MSRFQPFPKIEQFRKVAQLVKSRTEFVGKDENGKAVRDGEIEKPTLTFCGTTKLHGTNAGIGYDSKTQQVWAQSRNNVLSEAQHHLNLWHFVQEKKEALIDLFRQVPHEEGDYIYAFGEWIGHKVQKGVAISNLTRRFVLFDLLVVKQGSEGEQSDEYDGKDPSHHIWHDEDEIAQFKCLDDQIYNIHDYDTWTVDVDFNKPHAVSDHLEKITDQVERECPVGRAFGQLGVGEGVVWRCKTEEFGTLRFKVKGEKHRVTKTDNDAAAKPPVAENVLEFVSKTVTENRLEQGLREVYGVDNEEITMKKTGEFVKWLTEDVLKEESDTIAENLLDEKIVVKQMRRAATDWLRKKCNMSH